MLVPPPVEVVLTGCVCLQDDTALSYLGLCHQHGLGVHKSLETAFNMYTRASRHGNALADLHLAMFYENGWGGGCFLYH